MSTYPQRKSLRWRHHDYNLPGYYFVTVCTYERRCILGDVRNGVMYRNAFGRVVHESWQQMFHALPDENAGLSVVMPNHFHALFYLPERGHVGTRSALSLWMGRFKMRATKAIHIRRPDREDPVWQRGYWDRVVRTDSELDALREYIRDNPLKWHLDRLNPLRSP